MRPVLVLMAVALLVACATADDTAEECVVVASPEAPDDASTTEADSLAAKMSVPVVSDDVRPDHGTPVDPPPCDGGG